MNYASPALCAIESTEYAQTYCLRRWEDVVKLRAEIHFVPWLSNSLVARIYGVSVMVSTHPAYIEIKHGEEYERVSTLEQVYAYILAKFW